MISWGTHLVSRRQVRNYYLSLRGVAQEACSESDESDEEEEPGIPLPVENILADILDGWDPDPPPFNRCWRMPYAAISRKDKLAAAVHICMEIAQSKRIVFLCFLCHTFTVGYICYQHHLRSCLNMDSLPAAQYAALRERRFFAPTTWQWADCDHCIRQEVLATRHNRIRPVSAILHWARLLVKSVLRRVELAPLFCSTPALNGSLGAAIAQYL